MPTHSEWRLKLCVRTITSKGQNVAEVCETVWELNQLVFCILVCLEYTVIEIEVVLILLPLDNRVHIAYLRFIRHEYVNVHGHSDKAVRFRRDTGHEVVPVKDGNVYVVKPHRRIPLDNYHGVDN